MGQGPDIRRVNLDPSAMGWLLPAEARHRISLLRQVASIAPNDPGAPPPSQDQLQILAELLDGMFPNGATEVQLQGIEALGSVRRGYLAHFLHQADQKLAQREALEPATLLGFPDSKRAMWASLLGASWIPWQQGWIGLKKS